MINVRKLKWRWVYNQEPSMEPDEHGRWMVKGYIEVEQGIIPDYDWVGNFQTNRGLVPLVITHIFRGDESVRNLKGFAFEVIMPHITDIDNGLASRFHAATFKEAQEKAQATIDMLANCLVAPSPVYVSSPVVE